MHAKVCTIQDMFKQNKFIYIFLASHNDKMSVLQLLIYMHQQILAVTQMIFLKYCRQLAKLNDKPEAQIAKTTWDIKVYAHCPIQSKRCLKYIFLNSGCHIRQEKNAINKCLWESRSTLKTIIPFLLLLIYSLGCVQLQ